jgi:GPH family glycoside/pentoside/hexuronide:cation symporter
MLAREETSPSADAPGAALSPALIAAWASPTAPLAFATGLVSIYFLKYGTDVLHVAPGPLALVLGFAQLWDAAARPIVGFLSDRTRHRLGRRRSWMLASALPIALSLILVWNPPPGLEAGGLLAWLALWHLVLAAGVSGLDVPRRALPAELSARSSDRTRLFAANGVAEALSSLIAFTLGLHWLRTSSSPRTTALWIAVGLGVATLASTLWLVARVREPAGNQGRGGRSALRTWAQVLRNPFQQRLMLAVFLYGLPLGAMGVLAPYLFQYTLRRPQLTEIYLMVFFLTYLLSVALWVRASRRFRKVHLLASSLALALIAYLGLYASLGVVRTGADALLPMLLAAGMLGISMSAALVLSPAIRAEIIDHDELLTGERKEGVYTALGDLVFRLGSAVSIALAGWALEWSGFKPGGEQDPRVETTILWAMTLVPAACVGLAILPLLRFGLTEREHAGVLAALERRRASGSSPRAR